MAGYMGRTTMVPLRRLLSGILVLLWAVSSLPAQEPPCSQRTVLATVIDREGNPIRGLTAADFRGEFRGHTVQIISATLDTRPRRIVVLVDASGSMTEADPRGKWDAAKMIALDFLASTKCSVSLLTFSTTVLEKVGFASDAASLAEKSAAIERAAKRPVKGYRKTALYDAVKVALADLGPQSQGDVIYAITDGGDNASRTRFAEVEEALLASEVRFFAFLILSRKFPVPPEEDEGPRDLLSLTQRTGGRLVSLYPDTALPTGQYWHNEKGRKAILEEAFHLYQQMGEYYRMEIRLPLVVDKPRNWRLDVVDATGKVRRDVEVLYPRRLMPCSGD